MAEFSTQIILKGSEETKLTNYLRASKFDSMRKREDFTISLRKKNKYDKLTKKRAKLGTKIKHSPNNLEQQVVFVSHPALSDISLPPEELLQKGLELLMNESKEELEFPLIVQLRRTAGHLSQSENSDTYIMILQESIPVLRKLSAYLESNLKPLNFMKELSWLLLNIFTFPQTQYNKYFDQETNMLYSAYKCIESCIINLKQLCITEQTSQNVDQVNQQILLNEKIIENCIWIFANLICGSKPVAQKAIVDMKIFNLISKFLFVQQECNKEILNVIEYLLENVSRLFQLDWIPEFVEFLRAIGSFLQEYMKQRGEEDRFLQFLIKFTDKDEEAIKIVMEELCIVDILIGYIRQNTSYILFLNAVRLIGNISTSDDSTYIEQFEKRELISLVTIGWLNFTNQDSSKEVLWLLSNIIASSNEIMTRNIITNPLLMNQIKSVLKNQATQVVLKEGLHIFANICTGYGTPYIDILIFEHDYLSFLLPAFTEKKITNSNLLILMLEALDMIFFKESFNRSKEYYLYFEKLGGIDFLEEVQSHPNAKIYDIASKIIQKYGDGERVESSGVDTLGNQQEQQMGQFII